LKDTRLLILTTHEAFEPIRHRGRIHWRVNDNCVEIDATSWFNRRSEHSSTDWSAHLSAHTFEDVDRFSIGIARRFLKGSGEAGGTEPLSLEAATDEDFLRRLTVMDDERRLTNAGSLLFVGTPESGIDYIRRDHHGGDSTVRIRGKEPLIEQLWEVEKSIESNNRRIQVERGFAHTPLRAIPPRAVREASVNGLIHRD